MKKYFVSLLILVAVGGGFWYYQRHKTTELNVDLPPAQNFNNFITDNSNAAVSIENQKPTTTPVVAKSTTTPVILPAKINLNVPFTSQAPTLNWGQPFQDACEETSIMMVDYYYSNKKFPAPVEVESLILALVQWQIDNWGGHKNLAVAKVADLVKATYNYDTEIVQNLTVDKIKKYLQAGRPVIVPANGKKLANPNFTNGGPEYHMLVIKGYIDNKFITNDPGTRKGADFIYTQDNLMNSIADWDESSQTATGPKRALIILP